MKSGGDNFVGKLRYPSCPPTRCPHARPMHAAIARRVCFNPCCLIQGELSGHGVHAVRCWGELEAQKEEEEG